MNATGVIVEYNPYHYGHLHHIKQSRNLTDADVVIAVMSGHFLQRGEPSFAHKWLRTEMALRNGVDIVVELPYVFATAPAVDFAKGGVAILEALKCQYIAFGSEEGDIAPFLAAYNALEGDDMKFQQNVQLAVKNGLSYPQALNTAYKEIERTYSGHFADLTKPNNILGYHYVEQIFKQHAHMQPMTIPRVDSGYHDAIHEGTNIQSATGIRQAVFQEGLTAVQNFLPPENFQLLQHATLMQWETIYPTLRFMLTRLRTEEIAQYAEVTEGIEHLLKKAALTCDTFDAFMQRIKSKRYTWTRLQRMLTHIYTGFTSANLANQQMPSYIRLLGMTKQGQAYISAHKKDFSLPIVSRAAASDDPMLLQDIRATDLYMLASNGQPGEDYRRPPIRIL